MKELRQGGKASYQSERMILEFLETLHNCIKDVMNRMHKSESISLMMDESTSILKQLVIYGRGVVEGELECHFLRIRNLFNGQAVTIEKATHVKTTLIFLWFPASVVMGLV